MEDVQRFGGAFSLQKQRLHDVLQFALIEELGQGGPARTSRITMCMSLGSFAIRHIPGMLPCHRGSRGSIGPSRSRALPFLGGLGSAVRTSCMAVCMSSSSSASCCMTNWKLNHRTCAARAGMRQCITATQKGVTEKARALWGAAGPGLCPSWAACAGRQESAALLCARLQAPLPAAASQSGS